MTNKLSQQLPLAAGVAEPTKSITLHATMLCIRCPNPMGILITGAPGVGKSELALSLLDRGHQLISDDMVLIKKKNSSLVAQAPISIQGFLWVRSLGAIDIQQHFGNNALKKNQSIDWIIHLENNRSTNNKTDSIEETATQTQNILDIVLPKKIFHLTSQRNMPLLLEIWLQQLSWDATQPLSAEKRLFQQTKPQSI